MADKKEQNNKEFVNILGNKSIGINIPTKTLFEKSGTGKKSKPKNNPNTIDKIAFFSVNFLL